MNGTFEGAPDAHAVQPLYALKLAEAVNMAISASIDGESVTIKAG